MAQALAQARAMGGQPGEPGLQSPPGQRMLENLGQVAGGYGMGAAGGQIASALMARGIPALQGLGQAGAIFPEGAPASIYSQEALKELESVLPDAQKAYMRNANMANWHARMEDFPAVLRDKWALHKFSTGAN